jgi:trans-aconitate methyltransferase
VTAGLLFARSIVTDVAHKLLYQRRRKREQVSSDYERGEWAQQLAQKRWLNVASLEEYLIPRSTRKITALVDGRVTRLTIADYYAFRARKLNDIISANDGGASELVELGCGTGKNLCTLAMSGRWSKLRGFDISETGLRVAGEAKAHFGLDQIELGHVDLLDPSLAQAPYLRDATVFSYLCLEQLPNAGEQILRNLVAAGVRRAIHVEPSLELFSFWRLRDLATRSYIWRQDYQLRASWKPKASFASFARNAWAMRPASATSRACWSGNGSRRPRAR